MARRGNMNAVRTSRPPAAGQATRLGDGLALAAAVLGPLLLYALTLPRTVVLEDDGLFLMAGAHLGIAHPPGYPLYTLLCHLFTQLPFGTVAFLGHLSSAVLGALACGAVYLCARLLRVTPLPAVTAAWLFGASEHVWAQAIIAEVYTLNALLFFATYGLILYGVRQPGRSRLWMAAAVGYGLSLANHWPLMVLALPGLLLAALPAWKALPITLPRLMAVSLVSAALPYAWMVVRSWQEPFISFYGPITNWGAFWHYVSRSGYADVDVSPSAGWGDRVAFLEWFGNEVIRQMTVPGFIFALLGFWVLLRRRPPAEAGSGLLVFLGNSVVLIMMLSVDFDFRQIAIFRPYSLVCYGLLALWLAVGLQYALEHLPLPSVLCDGARFRAGLAALACVGMTGLSVQAHWNLNDRSASDFTRWYADVLFDLLPQDAVLFVSGDTDTGPLGYYHFVEERRPDVELLNLHGLVYGNRLYPPLAPLKDKEAILRRFVDETDRPIFFTADDDKFPHGRGIRHHGFVKEVLRKEESQSLRLAVYPGAERDFEALLNLYPTDGWERFQRVTLLHKYGQLLGYVVFSGDAALLEQTRRLRALAARDFSGLMGMAEVLLKYGGRTHWKQIGEWLEKAGTLGSESLEKWRRARLLYLKGVLLGRQGRTDHAIALFKQSYDVYPHPDNLATKALRHHGMTP